MIHATASVHSSTESPEAKRAPSYFTNAGALRRHGIADRVATHVLEAPREEEAARVCCELMGMISRPLQGGREPSARCAHAAIGSAGAASDRVSVTQASMSRWPSARATETRW